MATKFFSVLYAQHCRMPINELRDRARADYSNLHGHQRVAVRTLKRISIHVLENVKKVSVTPAYKVWETSGINVITNRSC
jgi:hypothetical protein